ncbi:MAG: DUF6569 family protein [Bryobacteraceae bacterium]|jgi:hypothetical protein
MQRMLTGGVLALATAAICLAQTHLSGPFTHDNLTIFLIHGADKSTKSLLTLDEALDQHKVVVYETRNVNELAVENVSSEDVFIESGDIVKGGAQDRTLKDDLILPSKSGKVSLNSFCVEHGRWSRRGNEAVGTFGEAHQAIASKELKMAVKMQQDQREVWARVAQAQAQLSSNLRTDVRAAPSPTSFAMTLEAPAVQRSIDGFLQDLAGIINGKNDVVGYAFAIDGKLNSADVYASHELFAKLWMKLLRSSSVEAVTSRVGKKFEPVPASAVKTALADAESGKASAINLTDRTEVVVKETAQNVMFETRDRGQHDVWIHRNYLTK